MQLWVYIVCVLLLCMCVLAWSWERRTRSYFTGLPCFPPLPLVGNIHHVLGDGRALYKMIKQIASICDRESLPFILWFGPNPVFITQDPDDIKAITNNLIEKPYFYNFGRIWLGNGLVTAPGAIWKRSIKKLSGTFTASVVYGYMGVFNAQAYNLMGNLSAEVDKEPFDIIHNYLAYTTLEAICQTALGVQKITGSIVTTEYYEAFNCCLQLLIERGLNAFLHPELVYRLTPSYKRMRDCVAVLHNVSDTVLKKRLLERQEQKTASLEENLNEDENRNIRFKSFLDLLLEMKDKDPSLTEQQIKSEVDTIIVGGQETVASTLSFVLLVVGSKPEVQDKLYAEIKSIFGDSKRPVTKEDIQHMRYCDAVINETLRLYPPVPGFMRYADKDLELKSCKIPKGTTCVINGWGAGRSARVWGPDAGEYRPERWLEGDCPANGASFLPFSYGRRACIGKKYAMVIIKTILAHCIREFEFVSSAEEMDFKIDIALRPISGNLVKIKLREAKII